MRIARLFSASAAAFRYSRFHSAAGTKSGAFRVVMDWGQKVNVLPEDTDGGAVEAGYVSVSNLTRLVDEHRADMSAAEAALDNLVPRA